MLTMNKQLFQVIQQDFPSYYEEIDSLAQQRVKVYKKSKDDLIKLLKLKKKTGNFQNFVNVDFAFDDEESFETMSSAAAHEVKSSDVIFRVDQIDKDIVILEEKFEKVEKMLDELYTLQCKERPLPRIIGSNS